MNSALAVIEINQPTDDAEFVRPGKWWHSDGDRIVCELCPRDCALKDGDRGFCFVRQNVGGEMQLTTYGRSTGFCVDPIEKKPLNHFYPGTSVLSFGTAGCNLGCKFCQNWDISKSREVARLSERAFPEDIAAAARALDCRSVAFTYNDPVVWAEYAIDTAAACRQAGVNSVAVTAGYITPQAREEFFGAMDAANVDLKAFTEDFYHKLTLSHLQPVLDTLAWLHNETDVWFEVTNLVIPHANDGPEEFQRLCDWLLAHVGDEVPVHFTAFHPDFRMRDRERTPPETLIAARETALAAGLKHAYVGNVNDTARQSTYCSNCGKLLIERNWHELGCYDLKGNACQHCGHEIAGRFDDNGAGDWGRRRMPVDMRQFHQPQTMEARTQGPLRDMTSLSPAQFVAAHGDELLRVSSRIIQTAVRRRTVSPDYREWFPDALELAAAPVAGVFVSVKRGGHLRGCCGSFGKPQPLGKSLLEAALRTATNDPRFPRVSAAEAPFLDLEVWVLGEAAEMTAQGRDRIAEVEVGVHGLQIIQGQKRGLLLPSVPIEHQWDAEEFLNRTCIKAGLPPTAWKEDETRVLRFEGRKVTGLALGESDAASWEAESRVLSAREVAAYAQFSRQTLISLIEGFTPSYYCSSVTDANVHGVALNVSSEASGLDLTASKLQLRQTMPLQSTVFALCAELQRVLPADVNAADLHVRIGVLGAPALHGTAADADLRGAAPATHALYVAEGNRSAWLFDKTTSMESVLEQLIETADVSRPEATQVFSLPIETTAKRLQVSTRPRAVKHADARAPAVAGRFYPADADEIRDQLQAWFDPQVVKKPRRAALVPHAGWKFSGKFAADVLQQTEIPETVIVLSPKHTPHGVEWAVAPHSRWEFPGGELQSDTDLAAQLARQITGLELDAAAHQHEHGIEVELPILHALSPRVKVVGITIGGGELERLQQFADEFAAVLDTLPRQPLLVISSDMNHFSSDAESRRLDAKAIKELKNLDADALYKVTTKHHISMCGMRPAVVALNTLQKQAALKRAKLVGYGTSGDTTGNLSAVVGYAGMVFS